MKFRQRLSMAIATTLILNSAAPVLSTPIAQSNSSTNQQSVKTSAATLTKVTKSEQLWNVVAVSSKGRIFASFPRWLSDRSISVGEVRPDGSVRAFPGNTWNQWSSGQSPTQQFVNRPVRKFNMFTPTELAGY